MMARLVRGRVKADLIYFVILAVCVWVGVCPITGSEWGMDTPVDVMPAEAGQRRGRGGAVKVASPHRSCLETRQVLCWHSLSLLQRPQCPRGSASPSKHCWVESAVESG